MRLPESRPAVLVSLPRNDIGLARAARRGGADGLKVHVNVEHRASGTAFGAIAAEREALLDILDDGLPVGLVVGAGRVDPEEIAKAVPMGFDYFDLYAGDAPADYVGLCGPVTPMVALGPGDGADTARALVDRGVRALELSTLAPERYGTPLSLATLARLDAVVRAVDVPVVVPSQHALVAGDVARLGDAGAAAVLLGAVVLGQAAEEYEARLRPFVDAVRAR
jgi:thiazole synthase ThiGH ThiG subunit